MIGLHKKRCSKEAFDKRYPQLSFLLRFHNDTSYESEDHTGLLEELKSKKPDLILLTGLQHLKDHKHLFSYLKKNKKAKAIVFEKHLSAFRNFLEKSYAYAVIEHDQIELRNLLESASLEEALKEAVFEHPTDRVLLFKEEEALLKGVLRDATLSSSIHREDLYYHFLFRNLLKNFKRLPKSFSADSLRGKFAGYPAIICGAGPSLSSCMDRLKTVQNNALIFAGGSTLTALSKEGVEPHFGFALDPNDEEYERLHGAVCYETPILYASRLMPEVFSLLNGKAGYLKTSTGGVSEMLLQDSIFDDKEASLTDGLSEDALSVTTTAISAAKHLGCSPIILVGIDLAFTDKRCYADGVVEDAKVSIDEIKKDPRAAERLFTKKNTQGDTVYTSTKWLMESKAISRFAKKFPAVEFVDCIDGGLGFDGIEKMPFDRACLKYLEKSYDLKGMVSLEIENALNFSEKEPQINDFLTRLFESLVKVESLLLSIIELEEKKTKKASIEMYLFEMDLEDELAYRCFFESLSNAGEKNYVEFLRFAKEYKRLFSDYFPIY
ncbi:MAG: hypothetical protein S4CHLAM37_10660 [Chlamydiia bacterium]|nr:hypothetical protein [Chlamydiia bacterium]